MLFVLLCHSLHFESYIFIVGVETVYLTDLVNKKIINIYDGALLGHLGDADLLINEQNGNIEAVILQESRKNMLKNGNLDRNEKQIPWQAIKKIGSEIIVIDFELI